MTEPRTSPTGRSPAPAEPAWLDDVESRGWRAYLRLSTLLEQHLARDLAESCGLSLADYHVLATLSASDGRVRLTVMARTMLWSTSRLAHQVARMQRRGLVLKEQDDQRAAWIRLTPHGSEVLHEAAPIHVASVRRHLVDRLTHEQLRALADIADRVVLDPGP